MSDDPEQKTPEKHVHPTVKISSLSIVLQFYADFQELIEQSEKSLYELYGPSLKEKIDEEMDLLFKHHDPNTPVGLFVLGAFHAIADILHQANALAQQVKEKGEKVQEEKKIYIN